MEIRFFQCSYMGEQFYALSVFESQISLVEFLIDDSVLSLLFCESVTCSVFIAGGLNYFIK